MPGKSTSHGRGRSVRMFIGVRPPSVTHNALTIRYRATKDGKKPYIGKSERLMRYEDELYPHVERMLSLVDDPPLAGPLAETVRLCYPTDLRHDQGLPKVTKPDIDNVIKTLNDVIERSGLIVDDAQICDMHVVKAHSDPAGIWVELKELEG